MQTDDKSFDEEIQSRTQLKKDAKALVEFGRQLTELPERKLCQLPLSEKSLNAIREFQHIDSHVARNRQLAFIGKCLRNDDAEAAQAFLKEDKFNQFRKEPAVKAAKISPKSSLVDTLLKDGDEAVETLLSANPKLERQTLRQLIRNLKNAKVPAKQLTARQKLEAYLG